LPFSWRGICWSPLGTAGSGNVASAAGSRAGCSSAVLGGMIQLTVGSWSLSASYSNCPAAEFARPLTANGESAAALVYRTIRRNGGGILATVPWSALPCCAGRPVTVAPSATAWLAAPSRQSSDRGGAAALVAGPGNARGPAEVAATGALRPHTTVLSGVAATPAATLDSLNGAAVAHLAAHGHHHAQNPLFSTLDLAGGPLLGYDLQQLTNPPRMVVLSCCDLGLADVRPGDETLGMATALLAAVSSTVIEPFPTSVSVSLQVLVGHGLRR
jgi:hypothetical protein